MCLSRFIFVPFRQFHHWLKDKILASYSLFYYLNKMMVRSFVFVTETIPNGPSHVMIRELDYGSFIHASISFGNLFV